MKDFLRKRHLSGDQKEEYELTRKGEGAENTSTGKGDTTCEGRAELKMERHAGSKS